MLHISGIPGSFRVTRAGSVLAGLSFCQISSGLSSSPIVLPRLLDILAWPSRPVIRLASVRIGLRLGKEVLSPPELGVPLPCNLAGQLEMLYLIFSHRYQIGAIQQDVGRHQDRIVEQPRRHALELL